MRDSTHEVLQRDDEIVGPSNRDFGRTFAVVFLLLALVAGWRGWRIGPGWFIVVAVGFGLASAFRPEILSGPNKVWLRFGLLLHKVTSPILMGAIFFLVFAPSGWVVRLLGKDLLRLKRTPGSASYWISRQPPGPASESLKQQF